MKTWLLAIDIGTSGVKMMLLNNADGTCVSRTESYPTYRPHAAWAEQDPAEWWDAVKRGIPLLLSENGVDARDIAAIGVDGVSWTPVMLDAEGASLTRTPLWYDTRAVRECDEIREMIGEDRVFAVSGNPIQPYYTYPKVRFLRRVDPKTAGKVRHILTSNGWIVYKLTGKMCTDYSQAYGYPFFDMEKRAWDMAMLRDLGEDASLYPDLCESASIAGVTGEDAASFGLCPGIPVAAGALDATCGAVGAGVIDTESLHEQSGSAEGMSICQDVYRPEKGLIMGCHAVPGKWLLQGGTVAGANLLTWLADTMTDADDPAPAREKAAKLLKAAEQADSGNAPIFLPYMAGERSPVWDPKAVGAFYGMGFTVSRGDMVRSVMEGAAMALRHNLETAFPGGMPDVTLRAVGGASRLPVWMQIKADMTGLRICDVRQDEATAVGCAIVAGVAAGVFASFEEACARYVRLGKTYEPDVAAKEMCDARYRKYLALSRHMREMENE